jgi:ABC-2 type transport system ATP-binding protein
MIKISDLTLIYPAKPLKVIANRGINLEIPSTGLLLITGPNGSGKSSLFKILSGDLTPSAGVVEVDKKVVADEKVKQVLGNLFEYAAQDLTLNTSLSGAGHLKGADQKLLNKIINHLRLQISGRYQLIN